MVPTPIPLLLLKTKSQPTDPYDTYFSSHPFIPKCGKDIVPFHPIFIPVLQHRHINLDSLESVIISGRLQQNADSLEEGQEGIYGALIITSQRAVEALGSVLERVKANPRWQNKLHSLLAHITVYVVGPATASALVNLGFSTSNVLGTECGNGEMLARFILESYNNTNPPESKKPILFLVGEARRDIIPKTLHGAPGAEKIKVEEMVIYETAVEESFRDEFSRVIQQTDGSERWVTVFSPAGADVAVNVLKAHRESGKECELYVASIGPTTKNCLMDTLGRCPEAVAGKPSPEGLWEAITGYMKSQEGNLEA